MRTTAERCIMCHADHNPLHICRLVYEEPDDWVEVAVCTGCWKNAERRHLARLREREQAMLRAWCPPHSEEVQP
jgi:hypothetical protein